MKRASAPGDKVWSRHAAQWSHIASPLRPCVDDVALMAAAIRQHAAAPADFGPGQVLLMGVTPELVGMGWGRGALVAADRSRPMISQIWSGARSGHHAICADWLTLPFRAGAFRVVIGDGSLSNLSFPGQYAQLGTEITRVIAEDGLLVLRAFCTPDPAETLDQVEAALGAGAIGNFHSLKWRIAMALRADDGAANVRLHDIWLAFRRIAPRPSALTRRFGWPVEAVGSINNYRNSELRYSFPTEREVCAALSGLECMGRAVGSYELAQRCPVMAFRRKSPAAG